MRKSKLWYAWLACAPLLFATFYVGGEIYRPVWMITGAIPFLWGVVVATNYRGAADAMPTEHGFGPFRQTTSTAMIRLIFGFFILWGAGVFGAGVADLF